MSGLISIWGLTFTYTEPCNIRNNTLGPGRQIVPKEQPTISHYWEVCALCNIITIRVWDNIIKQKQLVLIFQCIYVPWESPKCFSSLHFDFSVQQTTELSINIMKYSDYMRDNFQSFHWSYLSPNYILKIRSSFLSCQPNKETTNKQINKNKQTNRQTDKQTNSSENRKVKVYFRNVHHNHYVNMYHN